MICCVYVTVVVFLVFWAPIRSITSLRALFPMQKIRENQSGIVNVSIKSSIVNECTTIPYSKDLFLVHYGTYWNQAVYIVYSYIIVFKRAANLIIHYIQVWKLVTLHDIFFLEIHVPFSISCEEFSDARFFQLDESFRSSKKENPISKYCFIFTIVFIIQNYRTW